MRLVQEQRVRRRQSFSTHQALCALLGLAGGLVLVPPFALAAPPADKKIVAVMPFGSPNNHSLGLMGHNAQPTFITELVKSGKVRVVDEKMLQKTVKRFEVEMGGLFDQNKIRQIGKFLKADYVITGQLSWGGDAYTMTTHVTNIESLELELADDVDFREEEKFRIAVRTSAKKIAAMIAGEGRAAGKSEAFLNIDPRHFHDTAEVLISTLTGLERWRYEGEIDNEDAGKNRVHVKMKFGSPHPGTPLQVFEEGLGENDKAIGVVYVVEPDERGGGFIAEWIKEKDKKKKKKGDFGLGARVSNANYRYRISIGKIEDQAEDNTALVEMFREKLEEELDGHKQFASKNGGNVKELAMDMGKGSERKKKLKELHELGTDFLIEGKFIGSPGRRRADFDLISALTGEVWGKLKFETRI